MKDITLALKNIIEDRYRTNKSINLLNDGQRKTFSRPTRAFVELCLLNRKEIHDLLYMPEIRHAMELMLVERSVKAFSGYNQFVQIAEHEKKLLTFTYSDLIKNACNLLEKIKVTDDLHRGIEIFLGMHFDSLRNFALSIGDADLLLHGRPVPCGEYQPSLQLDNLAISCNKLVEPVIDIGCGSRGELVAHLRSFGIEATGIDRFAVTSRNIIKDDWLQFHLLPCKWGTILSHISFSNHFKHHHLRKDGKYVLYAKKYTELLKALKPGGVFIYAPGLPFIEGFLPTANYRLERHEITTLARNKSAAENEPAFYSAHIHRCA